MDKRLIAKELLKISRMFTSRVGNELNEHFGDLVPDSGKCKTVQGEMLRAYSKISYRYYNDGDLCHTGYGIETAGSAYFYLYNQSKKVSSLLRHELDDLADTGHDENHYEQTIEKIGKILLKYLDECKKKGDYTPNHDDMLDYQSEAIEKFGNPDDEEDDDRCQDCGEKYEYCTCDVD